MKPGSKAKRFITNDEGIGVDVWEVEKLEDGWRASVTFSSGVTWQYEMDGDQNVTVIRQDGVVTRIPGFHLFDVLDLLLIVQDISGNLLPTTYISTANPRVLYGAKGGER